jgi:hypothetical protein
MVAQMFSMWQHTLLIAVALGVIFLAERSKRRDNRDAGSS